MSEFPIQAPSAVMPQRAAGPVCERCGCAAMRGASIEVIGDLTLATEALLRRVSPSLFPRGDGNAA